MSRPDNIVVRGRNDAPLRIPCFPHRLARLPPGVIVSDLRSEKPVQPAIFLTDPGCGANTFNDSALSVHPGATIAVLIYASSMRDLRPMLRGSQSFQGRGLASNQLAVGLTLACRHFLPIQAVSARSDGWGAALQRRGTPAAMLLPSSDEHPAMPCQEAFR
jgi:hypothetical protein